MIKMQVMSEQRLDELADNLSRFTAATTHDRLVAHAGALQLVVDAAGELRRQMKARYPPGILVASEKVFDAYEAYQSDLAKAGGTADA